MRKYRKINIAASEPRLKFRIFRMPDRYADTVTVEFRVERVGGLYGTG
jgi:hypothetical protein